MAYEGKIEISTSKGKVYLMREDGKSWIYDINSGILFGLRGNPIKQFPFTYSANVKTKDGFSALFWEKLCYNSNYVGRSFTRDIINLEKIYNIVKDKTLTDNIYYQMPRGILDKGKLEYVQYCKKNGYIEYREWELKKFQMEYKTLFEKPRTLL